jgi:hypothetical protein
MDAARENRWGHRDATARWQLRQSLQMFQRFAIPLDRLLRDPAGLSPRAACQRVLVAVRVLPSCTYSARINVSLFLNGFNHLGN